MGPLSGRAALDLRHFVSRSQWVQFSPVPPPARREHAALPEALLLPACQAPTRPYSPARPFALGTRKQKPKEPASPPRCYLPA
ncbi:hypothetical protein H8959_017577 [Pygathrix nigripes]